MLPGGVVFPRQIGVLDGLGGELAVFTGDGQHLVAGALDGVDLVAVDVPGAHGQHALMGTQDGIDDGGVGLGAAHQEVYGGVRRGAGLADLFGGGGAVGVFAVAKGLVHVGLRQPLQNGGMGAFQIVAVKTDHGICLLVFSVSTPLY